MTLFFKMCALLLDTIRANVLCILFVIVFVLISQAGLLIFNSWYNKKKLPESNDVAGFIFGTLSLIYSLILAFVIVAVWTDYEDLNLTIEKETDKINSILAHSMTLPDSLKKPLSKALAVYCNNVINEEWKMQGEDALIPPSAIPKLRLKLLSFQPQNKVQESIYAVLDDDLSCISDLHRERLGHTQSHVPGLVWLILRVGSVMVIIFSYFLNATSELLKRIYLFFLGSIIAMSLFLVYALDHPFSGSAQVSKKPYENILNILQQQS